MAESPTGYFKRRVRYFKRRVQKFLRETVFLKGLNVERGPEEAPVVCRLRIGNVTLKYG